MASIIVISGTNKGDYYPLGQRTSVIGRDEALPIQILDKLVSRKHMKIHFDKDKQAYYAVDMDSKHGILINGIKTSQSKLSDNDYITIGKTTLFFTLRDFAHRDNALLHYKKMGERRNPTITNNDANL